MPALKGQILLARFDYLKEVHGADAIARVLAALEDADRRLLAGTDKEAWYPFVTVLRLDRAICELIEHGDPRTYERLGEASCKRRTEWLGEHASLVSAHSLLARIAEQRPRFFDFGRADYQRTGFTQGELRFSEHPEPSPIWCASTLGFLRYAVQQLTGAEVGVDEVECQCRGPAHCRFEIRWRARTAERRGSIQP